MTASTLSRALFLTLLVLGALGGREAGAQSITFLHTPPGEASTTEDLRLVGNVFGAGELSKARVYYRHPGGRFSQVELRPVRGDEFEAVIPARELRPPAVEYYVVAVDLLGRRAEIFASEASPQSVPVAGTAAAEPPDHVEARPPPPAAPRPPAALPPPAAPAPAAPPSKLEEELAMYGAEDVVSLATRHEQVVTDAPAIASSLGDEELRQLGARTVPEALKLMPGLDTSRDSAGFHRIAVRGRRADAEVLVLYDGHALNSPYDGRALFELPTDNLERVEVIRGPGSALYGTGAFLGVVNLVPKRRDEVAATLGAGSFTTLEGSFNAGHTWGGLGLHADGAVQTSQGDQVPIATDFNSPAREAQGQKASDDPAGFTDDHHLLVNVGGAARAELGGGTLTLSGRLLHQDRGALLGLYDTVGPGSRLTWTVGLGDLTYRRPVGAGELSVRLYADQQQVDRFFQLTPGQFNAGGSFTETGLQEQTAFTTRTLGAEASAEVALHPTNRLEVGLSAAQVALTAFDERANFLQPASLVILLPALQPPAGPVLQQRDEVRRRLALGVYLQDQWRPLSALALTAGVRLDAIQLPNVSGPAGAAVIDGTRMVTSVDPRLGVVVTPLPNLSFKLLYGRAFRAPTMQELADATPENDYVGGGNSGNPRLSPATVDTLELGAEQVLATSEGKLRLRGDLFWNRFESPILAVDTGGNDTPLQNRDPGLDVKGVEAEARFEASARAAVFVNYSWFHAVDLAALAPEFERLTDVPQYRMNLGLQLPVGPYLNLDVVTLLGAERRNNDLSKLEALHHFKIPAYALVNVQLRTEMLFDHLEVALLGTNVLQQQYRDDVGRPDRVSDLLPGPGVAGELLVRLRL